MNDEATPLLSNALHAAAVWLERINALAEAVVVVVVHPKAAVGVWVPGAANVAMLPLIDDAGSELCEAVAPVVMRGLGMLGESQRGGLADMIAAGGRLQALLCPAGDKIEIRCAHEAGSVLLLEISAGASVH